MDNRPPNLGFKTNGAYRATINSLYNELNTGDLFGMKLPAFQRGLVWSEKQNIALIESLILGIEIGSYMVNITGHGSVFDNLLIEGQQRLNALHLYFNNAFPVFGFYWKDLNVYEQREIRINRLFTKNEICIKDDAKLREVYNRFNFGGTAHKDSERA